jgi:hypothetical protein
MRTSSMRRARRSAPIAAARNGTNPARRPARRAGAYCSSAPAFCASPPSPPPRACWRWTPSARLNAPTWKRPILPLRSPACLQKTPVPVWRTQWPRHRPPARRAPEKPQKRQVRVRA